MLDFFLDVNKTAAQGRKALLDQFEVLQVTEQRAEGKDSEECPDRFISAGASVNRYLNLNKLAGSGYSCPSKFYMHATDGYCQPCPDMTTSDPGALSSSDCVAFNTVILGAKDASLTYEARTNTNVNGYVNAQPSALTLNNGAVSYLKIRGYALLPDQLASRDEPIRGFQIERCEAGLNCFNESAFRESVSALIGTVTPNEVRLVKPNTCLFTNPTTVYDGLSRTVPLSMQEQRLCGPWPGGPEMSGKCVCGRKMRRCFYTKGTGIISRYLGDRVKDPMVMTNVETVGECASRITEAATGTATATANAFLYHPGKMLCSLRLLPETRHALDLCSSHSEICRNMAAYFSSDIPIEWIEPGMQMYWEVSSRTSFAQECQHVVEDYWDYDRPSNEDKCSTRFLHTHTCAAPGFYRYIHVSTRSLQTRTYESEAG